VEADYFVLAVPVERAAPLISKAIEAVDTSLKTLEQLATDVNWMNGLKDRYTIIIVTHNMQQAGRVSDDTAFFNLAGIGQPGRLIEVGPTARIFSQPAERQTEDYIAGRFG